MFSCNPYVPLCSRLYILKKNVCMGTLAASMSVYHVCMPDTCGGQRRSSSPLELESQMAVSHHVTAGN